MALKTVEVNFLGQIVRLNCPEEQHDALREAGKVLDKRVNEMKERTGILQVEKALAIVALNLSFELLQEQQKTERTEQVLQNQIQQLTEILHSRSTNQQTNYEIA
ncbi:MAG: cell division protein ZapA [Lonepinella koalarum]|nr:cell division protein ZapA [Lonepinella koalarum]